MSVINKITAINPRAFVGAHEAWNILNSTNIFFFKFYAEHSVYRPVRTVKLGLRLMNHHDKNTYGERRF